LWTLARIDGQPLPNTRISSGDVVTLAGMQGELRDALRAIVYRRRNREITVALNDEPEYLPPEPIRADRVSDDTTFKTWETALGRLRGDLPRPLATLREICFGEKQPAFTKGEPADAQRPPLRTKI